MSRALKTFLAALSAFFLLFGAGAASAVPITYQYWGEASGTLGGVAFSNAGFLITAQADTSNVAPWANATVQNTHSAATITISGFGTMSFSVASHT